MATYNGTSGNDYYDYIGTQQFTAYGNAGNDTIYGNTGNDYIFGGGGKDKLYGWTGNDRILGESGNDSISGGNGSDFLSGDNGNDSISGEDGNDLLSGGTDNDTLLGGKGNDTINGSADSPLYNSYEYDVLNGGNGSDIFVLGSVYQNSYQGVGYAIIEDYNSTYDSIQLKGSPSTFRLDKTRNTGGGTGIDTQIFDNESNDLLAIVQDTTNLQLTSYYFKFV